MNTQNNDNEEPKVITPTEARQGQKSFALRVLVISTGLIILMFAIIYGFYELIDRDQPEPLSSTEDVTETTPPPNIPPAE